MGQPCRDKTGLDLNDRMGDYEGCTSSTPIEGENYDVI